MDDEALGRDSSGLPELCFGEPLDPLYGDELALRQRVLAEPLGLSVAALRFPFEQQSLHLWAFEGGRMVGCVLFHRAATDEGRLYQMAVEATHRGRGLGRRLVRQLEDAVAQAGVRRVRLHARGNVVGFYERLGYACEGEPFVEVGIEHRHMAREL